MSVEINELRVGNFICRTSKMQPADKIFCIVAEILKEGVCIGYWQNPEDFGKEDEFIKKHIVAYEDLIPIGLDSEWLERMGFEHREVMDESHYILDGIWFCHIGDDWHLSGDFMHEPFHYVHQLQNLYFALTGKEIEIK